MKAFVIKNKEGKYFGVANNYNYEHYWTTLDFAHYFRYLEGHDTKAEAEGYRDTRYPDCEVVEITIAEGDLEKENAVLRKALELACEAHSENDKAYKIKSKQRSANKYFDYFIQQAKEQRDEN